jgi:osmotically-inducible protein OsmY
MTTFVRTIAMEHIMKTDTKLKTDVLHELAWDIGIDDAGIGVATHHGVVTLTGTVASWAQKHAIEEAAYRVAGVRDLANEIEIKPSWSKAHNDTDIAEAVRSALVWNRLVPDGRIRSTVADSGMVTLSGSVRTLAERDEAERAVRQLDGVRCVVNDIAVDAPPVAADALRTTITQALERRAVREAAHVGVEVHGDTVVLTGNVGSWFERRAVLGAARGTPGVGRIDDRLRVAF